MQSGPGALTTEPLLPTAPSVGEELALFLLRQRPAQPEHGRQIFATRLGSVYVALRFARRQIGKRLQQPAAVTAADDAAHGLRAFRGRPADLELPAHETAVF